MTKDYRWRLTNKVKRVLSNNYPVVIIGGPKMGKSHLVRLIQASKVPAYIREDVEAVEIPELIAQPSPTLVTTDIRFLNSSLAYKDLCFRVPLTTVMQKHIQRWNHVDWKTTVGHPALASSSERLEQIQTQKQLREYWNTFLGEQPYAADILWNLRRHPSSPVDHYQRLRKIHGKGIKPTLDWLVCLGAIHRQKYKNGAGISPVPEHNAVPFILGKKEQMTATVGSYHTRSISRAFK